MRDDAPKTFTQVFSPSDYGFKKFEWVKKPTHVPEPRTQTLYGIEVEDADGNPMHISRIQSHSRIR